MTKYLPFFLDNQSFLTNQKCYIITGTNLAFLTCFLNSKLFKYCFREHFPQLQGGTRELSKIFFEKIPVPLVSAETNKIYEEKVIEIQKYRMNNTINYELENEIDEMIMNLFSLNKEEKDTIRSFSI